MPHSSGGFRPLRGAATIRGAAPPSPTTAISPPWRRTPSKRSPSTISAPVLRFCLWVLPAVTSTAPFTRTLLFPRPVRNTSPPFHGKSPGTFPPITRTTGGTRRPQAPHPLPQSPVWGGNTFPPYIPGECNDTVCPHCGAVLVSQRGYQVNTGGLMITEPADGRMYHCAKCRKKAVIRY
jgi:hypothetical protein